MLPLHFGYIERDSGISLVMTGVCYAEGEPPAAGGRRQRLDQSLLARRTIRTTSPVRTVSVLPGVIVVPSNCRPWAQNRTEALIAVADGWQCSVCIG